jgi:ABC-type branched-subunit amino acid transport system substrate-binding protein
VLSRPRTLVAAGVACLAALAVAGCSQTGSSSSSSSVTVSGNTLSIYISDPSSLHNDAAAQDVVDAERLAFTQDKGQVKDYKLALYTLRAQPSYNARAAIIDKTAIAYLGELQPGVSDQSVGITNTLDVLQVSPTDTALELSQSTPAVVDAPKTYFESWSTYGRTFARVVPSAADEAKAQVAEMKSLGVSELYVTNDGSDYGKAIADAVRSDASNAGIKVSSTISGAGADFDGAESPVAAARFFDHVASVAPSAKLFGPSSLNSSAFTSAISSSIHNLYVSIPGFLPKDLPAQGKTFVSQFKTTYGHTPNTEAIFGYAAMAALLHVIQREGDSANDRTSVVNGFLRQKNVPSVLGTYSIDSGGNTSVDAFVFAHMSGGSLVPFKAAPAGQG